MLSVQTDEHFMKEALQQAQMAYAAGEVPVGAVVVAEHKIIAKAYNQTEQLNDATAHAEMLAITAAQNYLGSKYLTECTLFVTLEPCTMCAGGLYWTQLGRLVYAANDKKRGYTQHENNVLHPKTTCESGLFEHEASKLIRKFFEKLRK